MENEDSLKRDKLLLEARKPSYDTHSEGIRANSPGAWHQSARAEFVSYEDVGTELTISTYSVAVKCHYS